MTTAWARRKLRHTATRQSAGVGRGRHGVTSGHGVRCVLVLRRSRTIGFVPMPEESAVRAALATVNDPEIRKPITELNMVESVAV